MNGASARSHIKTQASRPHCALARAHFGEGGTADDNRARDDSRATSPRSGAPTARIPVPDPRSPLSLSFFPSCTRPTRMALRIQVAARRHFDSTIFADQILIVGWRLSKGAWPALASFIAPLAFPSILHARKALTARRVPTF